jgi:hypothetical protein
MYRLPHDVDLSFFCNRTLFQVCIGANEMILNFGEGLSITVTSSIGWTGRTGAHDTYEDFSKAASAIVTLLDDLVTSAHGDAKGTLSLNFHSGIKLEFYDNSDQYESYLIKNGDKLIVV